MMAKTRRWLPAAALLPLMLAACTSTPARPGTARRAGRPASSAAHGGLTAVRYVRVIELENQGYAQSFGTPPADRTWPGRCRGWGPCWRTTTR